MAIMAEWARTLSIALVASLAHLAHLHKWSDCLTNERIYAPSEVKGAPRWIDVGRIIEL